MNASLAAALLAELQAASALLLRSDDTGLLLAMASHALGCALLALIGARMLPAAYRAPARSVFALLWTTGFFIPGGGLLIVAALALAHRYPRLVKAARYQPVRPVEFQMVRQDEARIALLRLRDARRALLRQELPVDERLRFLVAMQQIPPRAVVPLLQQLLGDPTEDIRLLAYSMIDNWEKQASDGLLRAQKAYEAVRAADDTAGRMRALSELVDLGWWQIESGLVRGDLRRMAMQRTQRHCEQLLKLDAHRPSVWRIYVQLLLEAGQVDNAQRALHLAARARLPRNSLLQLRLMLAHAQRDWPAMRLAARKFEPRHALPTRWQAIARFWEARASTELDLLLETPT
jgi:hypothetical protein